MNDLFLSAGLFVVQLFALFLPLIYVVLLVLMVAIKVSAKRALSADTEDDGTRIVLFVWWPVFFLISLTQRDMGPIWMLDLYWEAFRPNYEPC